MNLVLYSPVVDVWHGESELWGPERACCVQWRQSQVSADSIVVLDYSQQFYPRRDGSAPPVCDRLFPAPSWWFQGAISSIPNHCRSHTWNVTHGTHMVRVHMLGNSLKILILTFFGVKDVMSQEVWTWVHINIIQDWKICALNVIWQFSINSCSQFSWQVLIVPSLVCNWTYFYFTLTSA